MLYSTTIPTRITALKGDLYQYSNYYMRGLCLNVAFAAIHYKLVSHQTEAAPEGTWEDFTQESSMHGIRFMKRDVSIIRRIIWVMLILGSITYFSFAAHGFLDALIKRSVKTSLKVKTSRNLTFPVVTICSNNLLRSSILQDKELLYNEEEIETFKILLGDMYVFANAHPERSSYSYNWSSEFLTRVTNENASMVIQKFYDYAPPLEKMLVRCMCFQFNQKGDYISYSAGSSRGLRFTLNSMVDEYFIGPHAVSEGFAVALHGVNQQPLLSHLSYKCATGFQTEIMVTKQMISRVPPPADDGQSNCFDTKKVPNPLLLYPEYSISGCIVECKVWHILSRCQCQYFLQPRVEGERLCNIKELLLCAIPALIEFEVEPHVLSACKCNSTCEGEAYAVSLSSTKFPSDHYLQNLLPLGAKTDYIVRNYAAINIYYSQLSYESLEEKIAYTGNDAISNLGGTLGVCLGASLLTILEFLEFTLLKLITKATKVLKRRVNPMER
ncbi:ASIC1 [Bugula neritina]|uniref:ASIC1 n=1 Tax=Bugula neritina TaxID=10212 RepID=A0A7J7K5B7_BUGNE|nr:ASIC1 [Bugula neritina]